MKRIHSLIAAAAIVAAPAAQAQDAPIVFRPSGNWTADYGDDYCRLIRTFTDGTREMSLALERLQPGGLVRLIVVGEGMRPFRGADQITAQFLPSGTSAKLGYARAETTDGKSFVSFDPVILTAPPAAGPPPMYSREREQEAARGITGFLLTEGLISPVRVETGSLGAAVGALQACADDLLTVWGLDADKHKTMTAGPILNFTPSGVLPQGMVPFSKLGGGANQVRLLIGADGKVTACTIYTPSLNQSLNDRICSLARKRASFQPAKDAGGQPMASVWIGSPMVLGPPVGGGWRAALWTPEQRQVPTPDGPPFAHPIVPDNAFAGSGAAAFSPPSPATP